VSLWCGFGDTSTAHGAMLVGKKNDCTSITYDQARKLEELKYKLKTNLTKLEEQQKQMETLKIVYPDGGEERLNSLYQSKKNDDDYKKQLAICKSHELQPREGLDNVDPQEIESKLRTLKNNWRTYITWQEKCSQFKSIVIDENIDILEKNIDDNTRRLESLKIDHKLFKSRKCRSRLVQLRQEEAILVSAYPRAVKLQMLIKQAEKQAIQEIINQINVHAQIYMDHFLDGISVTLVFENTNSIDTTKLNVNVRQNEHISDLSSLSGGEISRVVLAFTIALAEINDVKLLLLDECIASLDQETTITVITAIRNNYKGTVLAIAHQTTTGVFDHVVEL
jgi:chromosome segregation ATPase